jgi:uncharacterized protein (TIGR02118 family)
MIAAISLMRRRADVRLPEFRRHWLRIHGPLVCAFPGLRAYTQWHVVHAAPTNAAARRLGIDGFPILWFDDDAARLRAHASPEMAACNLDSRGFVGAVSRVIADARVLVAPGPATAGLIVLFPGATPDPAGLRRWGETVRHLPGLAGLVLHEVREQGPAPHSTVPHLPVDVAGLAELRFANHSALARAAAGEIPAAAFRVTPHDLLPPAASPAPAAA